MELNSFEGKWNEIKGQVRRKWGKLTGDDIETVAGNKDILVGRLQQKYGKQKSDAEREVNDWLRTLS